MLNLWGCFVGRADMYMMDGLHLSGKGAAVFVDELFASVESGKHKTYFWLQALFKLEAQGVT